MRMFHTTQRCNIRSIFDQGLLVSLSQGKLPAVWLHDAERTSWAFLHCVRRHGGRIEDVVCLELEIDEQDLRKSSSPSLMYTMKDVDPECIVSMMGFRVVSQSPLEVLNDGG